MRARVLRLAEAAVLAWTRAYTWGLPASVRDARRREIESDLWETANDRGSAASLGATDVLVRLLFGMPDDVGWRLEQAGRPRTWRRAVGIAAAGAGVLALWVLAGTSGSNLPTVPGAPPFPPRRAAPPPPPPPPPPCAPRGFPAGPQTDCIR
jgi:hypothetical protein